MMRGPHVPFGEDAMHILLAEDDPALAELTMRALRSQGWAVDHTPRGEPVPASVKSDPYDLLILDIGLPGIDGLETLKRVRAQGSMLPVLMLTARDAIEDRVQGLETGADDYLVKPFALSEVEARLLALLRRTAPQPAAVRLTLGALHYNAAAQELSLGGHALKLPPKALRLAVLLMEHPNRVFSRPELETAIWGHTLESSDNLRTVLHTLRRAFAEAVPDLSSPGAPDVPSIVNVHGIGYKFIVA